MNLPHLKNRTNYNLVAFGDIEEYKKRNGIENFDCLYANKFN